MGKFRKLMPVLSLTFHLMDVASGSTTQKSPVSLQATERPAAWCKHMAYPDILQATAMDGNISRILTVKGYTSRSASVVLLLCHRRVAKFLYDRSTRSHKSHSRSFRWVGHNIRSATLFQHQYVPNRESCKPGMKWQDVVPVYPPVRQSPPCVKGCIAPACRFPPKPCHRWNG